jgi:hypothetical protein
LFGRYFVLKITCRNIRCCTLQAPSCQYVCSTVVRCLHPNSVVRIVTCPNLTRASATATVPCVSQCFLFLCSFTFHTGTSDAESITPAAAVGAVAADLYSASMSPCSPATSAPSCSSRQASARWCTTR